MKYEHTREHMMPVIVELSYKDIQLIQQMAKARLEQEETPSGLYKGEIRTLEREAGEVLSSVSSFMQYAFPKIHD
jgi:hypothetical protein